MASALWRRKMLLIENICCLLFFSVFHVQAEPYKGGQEIRGAFDFDSEGSRGSSVADFDITDRRRPSVEDFYGTDLTSVENFGTPPPTKKTTNTRTVGSWSSWSRKPNPKFPKRNKTTESPRSTGGDPVTKPDLSVERIVVFPCQDQKLRWEYSRASLSQTSMCGFGLEKHFWICIILSITLLLLCIPLISPTLFRCKHIPSDVDSPYHCKWTKS